MVIGAKYLSQGAARRFRRYGSGDGGKDTDNDKVCELQH